MIPLPASIDADITQADLDAFKAAYGRAVTDFRDQFLHNDRVFTVRQARSLIRAMTNEIAASAKKET